MRIPGLISALTIAGLMFPLGAIAAEPDDRRSGATSLAGDISAQAKFTGKGDTDWFVFGSAGGEDWFGSRFDGDGYDISVTVSPGCAVEIQEPGEPVRVATDAAPTQWSSRPIQPSTRIVYVGLTATVDGCSGQTATIKVGPMSAIVSPEAIELYGRCRTKNKDQKTAERRIAAARQRVTTARSKLRSAKNRGNAMKIDRAKKSLRRAEKAERSVCARRVIPLL